MTRSTTRYRVLVGLGVLALCGDALWAVSMPDSAQPDSAVQNQRTEEAAEVPPAPVSGSQAEEPGGQWIVRVDGWALNFDQVTAAQPPPPAEPEVAAVPAAEAEPAAPGHDYSSPYDHLIVKHAAKAGLDWRLVSALIYEESRFTPDLESDDGAYGLMQVREIAAREVGSSAFREPDANIRTGVRYLKYLGKMFSDSVDRDRMALVLAAYNIGPGHVQDAQALAVRYGYDPLRWDGSVELMLPLLERSAIHSTVPNGFARGRRTVSFVNRILDRYARSRRFLELVPDPAGVPAPADRI